MGKTLPQFWEIQNDIGWMFALQRHWGLTLCCKLGLWVSCIRSTSCTCEIWRLWLQRVGISESKCMDLCLYLKPQMIWIHIKVWEPLAVLENGWRCMLCEYQNGALLFYIRLNEISLQQLWTMNIDIFFMIPDEEMI